MSKTIPFNKPLVTGTEVTYIQQVFEANSFSGNGAFTKKCEQVLKLVTQSEAILLTPSCTDALELASLLVGIQPGDEVIIPSYTFVSTANPFVLRGAKIIFVDIRPDTMNIDETKIEAAITEKTKIIVPVHYAGVSCNMSAIMDIANKYDIVVVEDAAQGLIAKYQGRPLGSIGHLGCLSFHDTKNIHCGEGGALLINDKELIERAEIHREKGTDRSKFIRGEIDKYSWVDVGSSYLTAELNAAFLLAQLEMATEVTVKRLKLWDQYYTLLGSLAENGNIELPVVPEDCEHNGHIFYIKLADFDERQALIDHLRKSSISSVFHYIPLHSSLAGKRFGSFSGVDQYTTKDSERILRLPMYFDLTENDVQQVCDSIFDFFKNA